MRIAITRRVSPSFDQCELTHIERQPIDVDLARKQHRAYEQALASLGCRLISLRAEADLPDSVFVEDTAVVLPELAVITRPGADSRKTETESIAEALKPYRSLAFIQPPGAIDGGDVLVVDKQVFVGLSTRSNQSAIEQMRALLAPFGYRVAGVEMHDCLHLKTGVTRVAPHTLLINPTWIDEKPFEEFKLIAAAPSEPFAANGLLIDGTLIFPAAFWETRKRLETRSTKVLPVDITEMAKAEGGVTCCSLVFEA